MLQRAITRAARHAQAQQLTMFTTTRRIASTRTLRSGQTTVAALLSAAQDGSPPTVDHLMTTERAVQLLAEKHVDALPVVRDDKVIGIFTEHDYFDKVLNANHSAVQTSKVCEVATMNARLVVAYPEDTVAGCLEVMVKKNLNAIPVVEHDGHVMGTVTMRELTKEMLATDHQQPEQSQQQHQSHQQQQQSQQQQHSQQQHKQQQQQHHNTSAEPSHFPENILVAGGGYHDELTAGMAPSEQLKEVYDKLKRDLELKPQQDAERRSFDAATAERFDLDPNLNEMVVNAFSEASTFPEFTPSEDGLLTQTHGMAPSTETLELQAEIREAREVPITLAQSVLLDEMPAFSEPSDFPECPAVEEAIAMRERTAGSN